jgi:dolichol-phosphate mannosyltransferase
MKSIAIVCPIYREEQVIHRFHAVLRAATVELSHRYRIQIIYVLDPSPDRTEQILREIAAAEPDVELLVMSRRFGHQAALVAGIDHACADAVVMLDTDLQHPPALIPTLVAKWEDGADVVQTIRLDDDSVPWLKRVTSRWFYQTLMRVGSIELPMGAADYRLISRRVAEVFREQLGERNPFLRGLFNWVGFTVALVPFRPAERGGGRSKYRVASLMTFAANGICSFSKTPLRICTTLGLVLSAVSVLFVLVQIGIYLAGADLVPGWATLLGAVGIIGGVQLLFLGVIGEYIGIIFDEVKRRPRYLVSARVGSGMPAGNGGSVADRVPSPPSERCPT